MSDTPRTDAENCIRDMGFEKWVSIDFARELERELAAAKAQLVTKTDELAAAIKERDEAREGLCRLIALRRKERGFGEVEPKTLAAERGWKCFEKGGGA